MEMIIQCDINIHNLTRILILVFCNDLMTQQIVATARMKTNASIFHTYLPL